MTATARAFWLRTPGCGEIREVELPERADGDVLVRTLVSGVSRGTETLVFRGDVPPSQAAAMRAPFQQGDFPAPVEYGYLNVGVVEQGPAELAGRTVFCLFPHQTRYVVPASAVVPVPAGVPAERAVLAGAMETAVNALWDAAPLVGDRITVIGGGMVGCCVAYLAARLPGAEVELVDVDPSRGADRGPSRRPVRRAGRRGRRARPRRARERVGRRAAHRAPARRPRGDRAGAQLVRRPRRGGAARRGLPRAPARPAQQPGRAGRARAPRPPDHARPARAGARPARRPGARRPRHAASRHSRSCRTCCAGW